MIKQSPTLIAWMVTAGLAVIFSAVIVFLVWNQPNALTGPDGRPLQQGITATGAGSVDATPNQGEITLGIDARAATAQAASQDAAQKATAIIDAIKKLGVLDADIQTQNVSVQPQYNYGLTGETQTIDGYLASNTVVITTEQIDLLSDIVDTAVDAGANQVLGVYLTFTDEVRKDLEAQARQEAISEARQKAEQTAQAAGVKLGDLVAIDESFSPIVPYLLEDAVRGSGGGDVAVETPIEPGSSEVTVSVTITYEIK